MLNLWTELINFNPTDQTRRWPIKPIPSSWNPTLNHHFDPTHTMPSTLNRLSLRSTPYRYIKHTALGWRAWSVSFVLIGWAAPAGTPRPARWVQRYRERDLRLGWEQSAPDTAGPGSVLWFISLEEHHGPGRKNGLSELSGEKPGQQNGKHFKSKQGDGEGGVGVCVRDCCLGLV